MGNALAAADLEDDAPRDAFRAGDVAARLDLAVGHDEHVRGVRLGDEALPVEHERVIGAGVVRLDLREDRLDEIAVVDLGVEAVRREAPHAACDEREPAAPVDRRLELREHDQRRTGLVEPRIHAGGDLDAAGEGEANVHAVAHRVRLERAADLRDHRLVARDLREREGLRRGAEPREMLLQPEDAPVVEPQPLPHRVAALHGAVEGRDAGFVAMDEAAVDVDEKVRVAGVVSLEHGGTV